MLCSGGNVLAQENGYQFRILRLEGTNTVTVQEFKSVSSSWQHFRHESAGLGNPATTPANRAAGYAVTAPGGIFLRTIAEQAAGGDPSGRGQTGLTGSCSDVLSVHAGPALAGQRGVLRMPLKIRFQALEPAGPVPQEFFAIYWTYALNYLVLTADPAAAEITEEVIRWRKEDQYSLTSSIVFFTPSKQPEGTDFNQTPAIELRLPVVFGRREQFAITGGLSAGAPLSNPGAVARLDVTARFLMGAPLGVELENGTPLPPGSWQAAFESGGDYKHLPHFPAPILQAPAPGTTGQLNWESAPGVNYLPQYSADGLNWRSPGPSLTGNGQTLTAILPATTERRMFYRLGYSVLP